MSTCFHLATLAVRIVISPLAVIARRHAVRNGNFTEELSKYQDEVMTSYDDPKEGKLYSFNRDFSY